MPFARQALELSIQARFAEQVSRAPDRMAVSGQDRSLSYRELDRLSNGMARHIVRVLGLREEPVALLLDQGVLAVMAILAVLKAGKPYVPLGLEPPDQDLRAVVADSGTRLILADSEMLSRARSIAGKGVEVLNVAECLEAVDDEPSWIDSGPDSLAYIFYTSGSTGRPKGVFDCHRNVLHNILRYTNSLHIAMTDRLTLVQPPSFSGTVSSLFGALLNGATICPFNLRAATPSALAAWLNEQHITIYHSVPALFRSILAEGRFFPSVRLVRLEGDRASHVDWDLFCQHFPSECLLVNGLGITETGLIRQYFLDRRSTVETGHLPVGYPVADMDCVLVDDEGGPIAPGEVGEITVRSDFLSLGYWGDPEATSLAFEPNAAHGPARVFHTGDLGRLLSDGCLAYLGRTDFRIRLRGQWVDPERVEAALAALPEIRDAVVVGRQDHRGELRIVAYVVPAREPPPSIAHIRRSLQERLPAIMMPSQYVFLDSLPLTTNQKVDRRAQVLPEPAWQAHEVSVPPWTLLEQQLAEVWKEMLGVERVGLHDDFFDLGGHSLLAVQMLDRVEEMFDRKIQPSVLLSGATIAHLSQVLLSDSKALASPLTCLNTGKAGPPFIFLHGDRQSGGVYTRNLARFLDPARPFFVLAPAEVGDDDLSLSFGAVAERQLEILRHVQPHGPYLLGGLCNGGHVAFEMARRLVADGEAVPIVLMIRATARNVRHRLANDMCERLGRLFGMSAAWPRKRFIQWTEFVNEFERRSQLERVPFIVGKVLRLAKKAVMRAVGNQRKAETAIGQTVPRGEAYLRLEQAYVPSPYSGRITLLWPQEDEERAEDAAAHWETVANEVELHVVRGSHLTCVTRYSRDLAEVLETCLTRLT